MSATCVPWHVHGLVQTRQPRVSAMLPPLNQNLARIRTGGGGGGVHDQTPCGLASGASGLVPASASHSGVRAREQSFLFFGGNKNGVFDGVFTFPAMLVGHLVMYAMGAHVYFACSEGYSKTKGAHLAQCACSATIWAPGRTRDPYFEILGASLLPLAYILTSDCVSFVPPPLSFPAPCPSPRGGGGPSLVEPQKGQATAQGCCPKHSCGKW